MASQHQIINKRLTFGIVKVRHRDDIEDFSIKQVPSILIFFKRSPFRLS